MLNKIVTRHISKLALDKLRPIPASSLNWKANEDDPRKHDESHEALFYNLPTGEQEIVNIFGYKSPFNSVTSRYYHGLGRKALMVRKPALVGIDYLEKISSSEKELPNIRILYYGDHGTGKTHTLTHLVHYLHLRQEHIILHVRSVRKFVRSPHAFEPSTSRPGRLDTPINAAMLLTQFLIQNSAMLEKMKGTLVSSQEYKWSLREITKPGDTLASIAKHGVDRTIHASDCAAVLVKELMLAADQGKIKLATILDHVRFLFTDEAGTILHPDGKIIYVDEMTVARSLRKLIKENYKNGIVLATCDDEMTGTQNQTPREVLGEEGWDYFDPCLPINVPFYSRREFDSCMDFYQDVGWLSRPESRTIEARDQIRFMSGMNPLEVSRLCQGI